MTYIKKVLIALDQFANALLGGYPDEVLSSRCWRWCRDGVRSWPRKAVDALFFWERDHCRESHKNEVAGKQRPPEMRSRR